MSFQLTKSDIKDRTREYWEKSSRSANRFSSYECYIDQLLGRELSTAKPSHSLGKVHTLALTVGESFEPLLQIVCVLKPQRVVLILNSSYGGTPGDHHGEDLKKLMLRLNQNQSLGNFRPQLSDANFKLVDLPDDNLVDLPDDTPTHVFRKLRAAFQESAAQPPAGYTNVVDITGAKNSMIVGAFLYAAHSGLPITYVDFGEYDSDWRRPYGYTCRIGAVANPYEAFHLRDWEQVRRLYESYNFRNARALLGKEANARGTGEGILGAMSQILGGSGNTPLFDQSDIDRVKRLASLFEMYEAWENGDYATAKTIKDGFDPTLPADIVPWSIEELGSIWPNVTSALNAQTAAQQLLNLHLALKQGSEKPSDSLFAQPLPLLAYVRDELAKIERLISKNEDYRSAYLRAAGLEEFLLKARLCISWLKNELDVTINNNSPVRPSALSQNDQSEGFKAMVSHSSADSMRKTLQRSRQLALQQVNMKVSLSNGAPKLDEYWKGKQLDFDTFVSDRGNPGFTRLRGEAIHTHLYIPRPIAEAALELVQAAVEEFERNWLEHFHKHTLAKAKDKLVDAPSWSRLCEVCELTFLPPRLCQ
ncbi:hypothetical protein [uncultured Chloroflexus sp.]|uniref:hypothetical protein n=1 Tax=uncultured Chloroflexus sp. TaxID=214040 RepID=UPI0026334FE0|nr:hypothetical protein [uncultured Chloroflexus sp.]